MFALLSRTLSAVRHSSFPLLLLRSHAESMAQSRALTEAMTAKVNSTISALLFARGDFDADDCSLLLLLLTDHCRVPAAGREWTRGAKEMNARSESLLSICDSLCNSAACVNSCDSAVAGVCFAIPLLPCELLISHHLLELAQNEH